MPLLRLLRVPGVFTAFADILAGFFILRFAGTGQGNPWLLTYLLGASACLYMAGMAWNDVFDAEEDSKVRPERPIPSGSISMTTAFIVAVILSIAGCLLAMTAGFQSFIVSSALLCMILLYNSVLKKIEIIGPLSMGSCRGLNLLLGMTAHSQLPLFMHEPALWLPPLLLGIYTTVVTIIAAMESGEKQEEPVSRLALLCGACALLLVPVAAVCLFPAKWPSHLLLGVLLFMLVIRFYAAISLATFKSVRALVGGAILGMVLLNGGMVAAFSSLSAGVIFGISVSLPGREEIGSLILIVAMIIPAWVLKRRISVT